MYIFCFEEVSAIKWSKMVTFSITGSQIFFANFVIFARNERKTGYRFTVPTTSLHSCVFSISEPDCPQIQLTVHFILVLI